MKTATRETEKGFYMFLESERLRHLQDIRHISILMQEIETEQILTVREADELKKEALKYVEIKEYKQ